MTNIICIKSLRYRFINLFAIIYHEIIILLFSVLVWLEKNKCLADRVAHVNFVCLYWEKEYEKSVISQFPKSESNRSTTMNRG